MTKTSREQAEMSRPSSHKTGRTKAEFKGEYDPGEEIKHLRGEIKRMEGERESYEKEHGSLKILFRELWDNVDAIEPPKINYKAPAKSKVANPVIHVSHWCDWHDGAVQEPEEIEGFREFNPEILRRELRNCERDQLEWCELHRTSYTINERRNLVTGDLISGGIHPELLWTNAYPEPVQAIRAGELLAEIVAMQSPHYQKVVVDFVTEDNHSRLTKKPQASEGGINTWNYVVGFFAKERLRDFENVEFNVYPVLQKVVKVGGRQYLITHGHHVRGWSGFPYYGIERKVGREAVKRMRRVLKDAVFDVRESINTLFHRVICGHWHAPMTHPWFWIGGSASGTTAYDHREGRESDPIQCSWMVHPKHGEFDRTDWLLRE